MLRQRFPILEYDSSKDALIEPSRSIRPKEGFERCVITFFREALDTMEAEGRLREVARLHSETVDIPIYETDHERKRVHITLGYVGAPASAGLLEELIAYGFGRFIVCGGAGVLQKDIAVGRLIIPVSAVRDEGTSYHYLEPSREVECSADAVKAIEEDFKEHGIPYLKAKTWTTDALYRETPKKVELRKREGCVTVEMEAAALFAVAQFRGVKLGQILYGGDDLSGVEWDKRSRNSRDEIRHNLVRVAMRICSNLG